MEWWQLARQQMRGRVVDLWVGKCAVSADNFIVIQWIWDGESSHNYCRWEMEISLVSVGKVLTGFCTILIWATGGQPCEGSKRWLVITTSSCHCCWHHIDGDNENWAQHFNGKLLPRATTSCSVLCDPLLLAILRLKTPRRWWGISLDCRREARTLERISLGQSGVYVNNLLKTW